MKNNLNRRLASSLIVGLIFFLEIFLLFNKIKQDRQSQGTSRVLRQSYLWNEKVWSILSSSKRLSVEKPRPRAGTRPRVNGNLGLVSPLPENYLVIIESGEQKLSLPVGAFKLVPKREYSTDFRCIEGWSEVLHYGGARFSEFLTHYNLGKKPDGKYYSYVGLETPDGKYYVSIDMESMLHDQTILSWEMNGEALSAANGAPLRLIIPIKYGIKSLKRIGRIYFSDKRPPDYWAERGYDWYSGL